MKKLLLIFLCLLSLPVIFVGCDSDDEDSMPTESGLKIVDGNVVGTEINEASGFKVATETTYVFINGKYDSQIHKQYYPSSAIAKGIFEGQKMIGAQEEESADIEDFSLSKNVITTTFRSGYMSVLYGKMTPEELMNFLESEY